MLYEVPRRPSGLSSTELGVMYSSSSAFHSRLEDEDPEDGPTGALSCPKSSKYFVAVVVVVGEQYQWKRLFIALSLCRRTLLSPLQAYQDGARGRQHPWPIVASVEPIKTTRSLISSASYFTCEA
ncbi:hypothetical protein AB1N83_003916 [Pleurotus pulmonarius]